MPTLFCIAVEMDWKVYKFDVKSAFLNGNLDQDVHNEQPEGFVFQHNENSLQLERGNT